MPESTAGTGRNASRPTCPSSSHLYQGQVRTVSMLHRPKPKSDMPPTLGRGPRGAQTVFSQEPPAHQGFPVAEAG
ncbi:hypothetical protein GCM10017673_41600 [Streptosporangium violaceochromogenes]|nr:hypothetical protein GCM10017673_41600 [Streptosporangium violaceochromogenes]